MGWAGVIDTLEDVREMYGECYQKDSAETRRLVIWRGFAKVFHDEFSPLSFCDVGCGAGGLVMAMREHGVPSLGIEGADVRGLIPGIDIVVADLRYPIPLASHFDLVSCFDVAEHVGAAETLCDTLRKLTDRWLLFGAAGPGQGGLGHIDLRPHEEWDTMLAERGLILQPEKTAAIDSKLEAVPDQSYLWWIRKNIHVYYKET